MMLVSVIISNTSSPNQDPANASMEPRLLKRPSPTLTKFKPFVPIPLTGGSFLSSGARAFSGLLAALACRFSSLVSFPFPIDDMLQRLRKVFLPVVGGKDPFEGVSGARADLWDSGDTGLVAYSRSGVSGAGGEGTAVLGEVRGTGEDLSRDGRPCVVASTEERVRRVATDAGRMCFGLGGTGGGRSSTGSDGPSSAS